ncbi:hypothetical protein QJQ45_005776 [Haematococcus lacustris]|nr:hypothetical protein QJQ45_005776 [Haematococcus lacustris]
MWGKKEMQWGEEEVSGRAGGGQEMAGKEDEEGKMSIAAQCRGQAATQAAASEPGPSTPLPAKRSKRTEAEQAAEPTQPTKAAKEEGSEPGPSTPQPAKRSKRTKAEPEAAEPTQPTKAAKVKPAPQPGRWVGRDCNAALNMQRIGESRWHPLGLCWWPDLTKLPAKGKEDPELGYKRLRDHPPKAQQQQQPMAHPVSSALLTSLLFMPAQVLAPLQANNARSEGLNGKPSADSYMQRTGESRWRPLELCWWPEQGALPAKGKEYPGLGYKRLRDKPPKPKQQVAEAQ